MALSAGSYALSISGATSLCVGATSGMTSDTAGGTWTSSNPSLATIDGSTGDVTGVSAGMGTCGLVGPIGCFSAMTESGTLTPYAWLGMFCICLFTPAVLSLIFSEIMRKLGWIKEGYMKLQG